MYELKCPSCEHVTQSSFVRIGAVVNCGSCGQVFRVAEAHVTRRAGGSPASQASADPLLAEVGGDGSGSPPGFGAAASPGAEDDQPVQAEPVSAEPIAPGAREGGFPVLGRRFWVGVAAGLGALLVLLVIVSLARGAAQADTPPDAAGAAEMRRALSASELGPARDARPYDSPDAPSVGALPGL